MELSGKVALITGGRRIGRALAHQLAVEGMRVAVSYHTSAETAVATVAECRERGVDSFAVSADLREPASIDRLTSTVMDRWERIDVLVNLVSLYDRTPLETLTFSQMQETLATNLIAPMGVAVAVAQQMRRQPVVAGLQGKIIHFTDWAVQRPYRDFLPYLVAKGALETLTRVLAVELAPTITVNAIAPGTVEPPPDQSSARQEQVRLQSALQRTGSPEDVNRAVLYLLAGSDFITGEVIRIDGGRFLGPVEISHS